MTKATATLAIEQIPIGKVLQYARNTRLHSPEQITQIKASIAEFGFVNPCLVDAAGVLIAGHGRVAAAAQLGMATVPVIRLGHLTETQARALRISDNSIALNSAWDVDMLKIELSDLKLAAFDMPVLGFGDIQLVQFMSMSKPPAPPEGFPAFDESIETEHECPSCHYRWSGKTAPAPEK